LCGRALKLTPGAADETTKSNGGVEEEYRGGNCQGYVPDLR
jgi:hypothetical protein